MDIHFHREIYKPESHLNFIVHFNQLVFLEYYMNHMKINVIPNKVIWRKKVDIVKYIKFRGFFFF